MRTPALRTYAGFAFGAFLVLAGCGQGDAPAPAAPTPARPEPSGPGAPVAAPDAPVPAPEAPVPAPEAPGTPPGGSGALPLTPGVYVGEGAGCGRPPNAGFRIYDGRGISGSSTRDCRATIKSSDGNVHQVEQSCEDTYSGRRSSLDQRVVIPTPSTFTLTEGGDTETFRLCAAGEAPSYLEDLARPR
ncbi:hypothetical protein [Brevundimonas sp.]|jgi:hypothetical protein|uniref:hypothetical protein n=1 Tax=Brevundimonas sp. TaxID=1871086 RepID=UPI002E0E071A